MATTHAEVEEEAAQAAEELRAALWAAGMVLPSLGPDIAGPDLHLVELGRVRADVARELAKVLR